MTLVEIAPVTASLGERAGALRRLAIRLGSDPPPSGVDAIVAALAEDLAARGRVRILTTDPDDLGVLAGLTQRPTELEVLKV